MVVVDKLLSEYHILTHDSEVKYYIYMASISTDRVCIWLLVTCSIISNKNTTEY